VYRDLSQLRDAADVPKLKTGETAKLVLDRSHTFFEPDPSDRVSVAVHGSNADGDNRLFLIVWQLVVIERDDNKAQSRDRSPMRAKSPL
jgi:hypothetical protein